MHFLPLFSCHYFGDQNEWHLSVMSLNELAYCNKCRFYLFSSCTRFSKTTLLHPTKLSKLLLQITSGLHIQITLQA